MNCKSSHRQILLLICVCLIGVVEVYTNPTSPDLKSITEDSSGAVNSTIPENQQNDPTESPPEVSTSSSDISQNETTSDVPEPTELPPVIPTNSSDISNNTTTEDVPIPAESSSSLSTIIIALTISALVGGVFGVGFVVYRKYYTRVSYTTRYRSEHVESREEENERERVHLF